VIKKLPITLISLGFRNKKEENEWIL
jgi:hypothetical protein